MRKLQLLVAVAALLALSAAPGQSVAAVRPQVLTLTPFAGGYVFEGNQRLKNGPIFGLAVGYNFGERWGAEGVATFVDSGFAAGTERDVNVSGARLDLLYHLRPDRDFVPYLAAGLGGLRLRSGRDSDGDGLVNYGLGFKYFLSDHVGLRVDARHLFDININDSARSHDVFHNFSYTAGLTFQFGDPPPPPLPPLPRDADGDGVPDETDRCPDTQAGLPVDGFGCPLDGDGDGIYDFLDRCPDTPAGVTVDRRGCPFDSDGDGVPDHLDRCPGTPAGSPVDSEGCSPPPPAAPPAATSLTLHLQFAYGEAAVGPEFEQELQAAADFIKEQPAGRILIEGHTDSIGSADSNLALSEERAAEVRRVLIEKYNLDAARIEARGFGETLPVGDNATPEGRLLNRRVVVTVLPGE